MGTVVDIYFAEGRGQSSDGTEHPDVVFVDMPSYCGAPIVPGHPKLLPFGPRLFQDSCGHTCTRVQFPLRLCWAITIHKSQGMTIGPQEQKKSARINLGPGDTEVWAAGSAFVQLSRVTEIGALCIDGPVTLERFCHWTAGKQAVLLEDQRLFKMHERMFGDDPSIGNSESWRLMVASYLQCAPATEGQF
jgi:hypothetical protein